MPVPEAKGKLRLMATVATGSDVLAQGGFAPILGMKVGFVGNHTSRLSSGTPTHLAIAGSGAAELTALFSPEHGAFGLEDHENVGDAIDPATGLPIHSLYGSTRKPSAETLAGLDALVFELQDVGARFYTYAATMLLCLEAAVESGIPLVVLDRPNPLGGACAWEGPLPDSGKASFVVSSDIPVRHGLTLGEIASIALQKRGLPKASLNVVRCRNYRRSYWWDETGLPWIAPSPAMRLLESATVYPGVCLLEQTNVSVGRGTDTPFFVAGAPWIDSAAWAEFIVTHAGPGVQAEVHAYTPSASKFSNEVCHGVRLRVTDRDALASVRLGITMCAGLQRLHPDVFDLAGVNVLLASDSTLARIRDGRSVEQICDRWRDELAGWQTHVSDLLLYS